MKCIITAIMSTAVIHHARTLLGRTLPAKRASETIINIAIKNSTLRVIPSTPHPIICRQSLLTLSI